MNRDSTRRRRPPRPLVPGGGDVNWLALAVWLFMALSMGSYRSRSHEDLLGSNAFDPQVRIKVAMWLGLGALAVWLLHRRRPRLYLLRSLPLAGVLGLIVLGAISAVRSPSPAYSLFMALQLSIVLVLVICPEVNRAFLYRALLGYVVLAVGLAIWSWGFAVLGVDNRLGSPIGHPSILSMAAAAGAGGLWARWCTSGLPRRWYPVLALFVLVTLSTISRTAIAGMVLAMALATLLSRRTAGFLIGGWFVALGATVELGTGYVSNFVRRGQTNLDLESLSMRTEVWRSVHERLSHPSFLGEGLGSTRWIPVTETVGLGHTHDLFLEALVTLGVIGGLLVILVLGGWLYRQCVFGFHGHGRWTVRIVQLENLSMLIPLLAFCILDRGFLTVDPLVPVYFTVMMLAQVDHAATSRTLAESLPLRRRRRRRQRRHDAPETGLAGPPAGHVWSVRAGLREPPSR